MYGCVSWPGPDLARNDEGVDVGYEDRACATNDLGSTKTENKKNVRLGYRGSFEGGSILPKSWEWDIQVADGHRYLGDGGAPAMPASRSGDWATLVSPRSRSTFPGILQILGTEICLRFFSVGG